MPIMLTPPKPRSPPLNALRAFEAAARLGGFKAAAAELSVTPGAIAQHVKTLEAWAGAALFERMSQGVRLTDLGSSVFADFNSAFDQLGEAVNRLRAGANPHQIRIAVLPSIAQLWLSQRLPRARETVTDTTISITALDTPPNLLREPFDLSLFFGTIDDEASTIDLGPDVIFPVCAPSLAGRIRQVSDLADCQILHDSQFAEDWPAWLAVAAPNLVLDTRGPTFSLYSLALQEAQNGAGVLMGHAPLVQTALADGSLVAPLQTSVELEHRLLLATPYPLRRGTPIERVVRAITTD